MKHEQQAEVIFRSVTCRKTRSNWGSL